MSGLFKATSIADDASSVPVNLTLPFSVDLQKKPKKGSRKLKAYNEQDKVNVEFLYVRGYSLSAIAKHLGITYSAATQAVKSVREAWRDETVFDFNAAIVENLRKLDELEMSAWREFEASREEEEVESEDTDTSGDMFKESGGSQTTSRKRTSRKRHAANARYLDIIEKCIEQRCRILGLYAPKEVAITQRKVNTTPIEELTRSELMSLAARQKKLDMNIQDAEIEE